ncbi:helix-turn-helix transcriptional regulator [Micromonospora arborensis]|uniref:helix-turn-helix domain-containing protein n=1 Tax=Micromonospora arborensis TaxID=2116518 RepID=UPI0033C541BE
MDSFGHTLRRHRTAAGLGLRGLAQLVYTDHGHLARVERGESRGSETLARACDKALTAGGALIEAYRTERAGDTDMRRRTVIQAMGALAAAPAVAPLVGLEALRHGLGAAVDVEHDEWEQIVADYGHGYYRQPHHLLMGQLGADMTVLQHQIAADNGARRPRLLRAAGRLSVIVALGLVASGQTVLGRRWWQTAQRVADESGDPDTQVLVRAWDVVNGCYDGRPPNMVVALSEQVLPLLHGQPTSAACGLLAGRAQALSLAGRHTEAVATVRQLSDLAEQLPAAIVGDVESLWGWPEHRLRHTESWVFTHAGQLDQAEQAQDRALALYPQSQARLRTQVQLHQAACLIRGGHIPDGLRLAADLLDQLPSEQHNHLLRSVARQAMDAVPAAERRRPVYGELVERVTV